MQVGFAINGLGLLVLALMVHGADDVTSWTLVPGELVAGMGMGLALPPLFDFILAGVQDHEVGSASGVPTRYSSSRARWGSRRSRRPSSPTPTLDTERLRP